MLPPLVARNDTVPWGTVEWSALRRIEPPDIMPPPWPIMPLRWPIIDPPISVRETFTTVPGRFGAAGEEPDRNPMPPGSAPPFPAPTATAADATRAVTAATNAPTSRGRLTAVTSLRPGCLGERIVGSAKPRCRARRWPAGGRGSPALTHQWSGTYGRCCRVATA